MLGEVAAPVRVLAIDVGIDGIPAHWRQRIAMPELLLDLADALHAPRNESRFNERSDERFDERLDERVNPLLEKR